MDTATGKSRTFPVINPIINTTRSNIFVGASICLFLILNTFKICVFNLYILYSINPIIFIYKFILTLLINLILYYFLSKFKSKSFLSIFYFVQMFYIVFLLSYSFFTHSNFHFSSILGLLPEGSKAASELSFSQLLTPKVYIAFIDLPIFLLIIYIYPSVCRLRNKSKIFQRLVVFVPIISIFFLQVITSTHQLFLTQLIDSPFAGESKIVEMYGTLVNSSLDAFIDKDSAYLTSKLKYAKTTIKASATIPVSQRPNFIIIQVESMGANIVNEKHDNAYVTPFLHSLTTKSVYYPYTLSYHEGGGTSDCEFSILNSVEPLSDYPAIKVRNYDYSNSLIKNFDTKTYDIEAFHGNEGSYFNRSTAFSSMGFQTFNDINSMNLDKVVWGSPDRELFDYVTKSVSKETKPYIYYTITISSHTPFNFASKYGYNNPLFNDISNTDVHNYFNSMSYVDNQLNKFVTYVKKNCKNTYVLIWGDHTPPINPTKEYALSSYFDDNKYFEYVPLFILTPNNDVYKETNKVASFVDVAPTILKASGTAYSIKTNGQNLLKEPIVNSQLQFKGASYSRETLFKKITAKERANP